MNRKRILVSRFIIISFLPIALFNCKSTSYDKRDTEIREMDEDEFFGESNDKKTKRTKESSAKRESKDQVKKVIKTARSFIGTPYKYGGTTRAGMDCSGLLCTSFRTVDVTLPRTSDEQSRFGKTIDLEDIREGDLLFFSERKGSKKVSHVGMVTEVNGSKDVKFIHSSTKLGVTEADLYAPYFIKIFVKATRPL
jgi:cell wall-associated NlpC family hydrolase